MMSRRRPRHDGRPRDPQHRRRRRPSNNPSHYSRPAARRSVRKLQCSTVACAYGFSIVSDISPHSKDCHQGCCAKDNRAHHGGCQHRSATQTAACLIAISPVPESSQHGSTIIVAREEFVRPAASMVCACDSALPIMAFHPTPSLKTISAFSISAMHVTGSPSMTTRSAFLLSDNPAVAYFTL
jgi:hypothetical protein